MKFSRTNIVLTVLLVGVVLMSAMARVDYSRPNLQVLPPTMKFSPAYQSYDVNPNFDNGRTLQAPVPGTIARSEMPLYFTATPEDAIRAGEELQNPYHLDDGEVQILEQSVPTEASAAADEQHSAAADEAAGADQLEDEAAGADQLAEAEIDEQAQRVAEARIRRLQSVRRGGEDYLVFCINCHGPSGAGDGLVVQRGFPPPPSLLTGKSPQMKDGQLFHILTYGQGSMPNLAAQLPPQRRWDVINHVRSMQLNAQSAPAGDDAGMPAAGASSASESESDVAVDDQSQGSDDAP